MKIKFILLLIAIAVFTPYYGGYSIVHASITDDANYSSITWTATVSGAISSYNYDTATFQSWNNGSTWGPFSVATWVGYFGSFTHIRVFDGACSALSMSACELLGNGYKDYWVDGSNWSPTDPSGPVYGCTDPDANNYDPDATSDDGSCTYDYTPSVPFPPWQLYLTSSSTCTQTSEGTSSPTSFYCTATSTQNLPIITRDELLLFIIILLVINSLALWRFVFTGWIKKTND